MGTLFLLIGLFIVGVICILIYHKKYEDWMSVVGWVTTIVGGLGVLFVLISLLTISSDFAYIEEEYNNLKHQLEYVTYDEIVTDENLRNQVLETNNIISKHNVYSRNPWVDMWYSEHIGNLPKLEYKPYI